MTDDHESADGAERSSAPDLPPPPRPHTVGSSRTAGQTIDEGAGRVFPCESCGGDMRYKIGAPAMICDNCGSTRAIKIDDDARPSENDFDATFERLTSGRMRKAVGMQDLSQVRCDSCGAEVVFRGAMTSQSCPFCGKPIQRANVHEAADLIPVDGVLPFLVERETAQGNLKKWVASRWFLPNDFKSTGINERFQGYYVPYWTFDSLTFNSYVGERGEHYWVTVGSGKNQRRERRTRWYPAAGRFQRFFDDVLVVAAEKMPRNLVDALEPWPLNQCVPFTGEVLAGFFAETYTVALPDGFKEARRLMHDALMDETRRRIGGDEQRVHRLDSRYDAVTYKHLLLPIWVLGYTYKEKYRRIVVNAATGEVQGERPWSWIKITLFVATILAIIAGIVFVVNRQKRSSAQSSIQRTYAPENEFPPTPHPVRPR